MEKIERVEKFFIYSTILIISSYLLVFISNLGKGFLCSFCGFVGTILQSPTSLIDFLLMNSKSDLIVCTITLLLIIIRLIKNSR